MFRTHRGDAYLAEPAADADEPAPDEGSRRGRLRMAQPWLVACGYLIGAVALTGHLWVDPAGRE